MFPLLKTVFRFSSEYNKIVYTNGKSLLSLSQMIGDNNQYLDPLLNNFYIKQHTEHQIKHESLIGKEMIENQAKLLQMVIQKDLIVRCIISPEISNKQMNLNINKLKNSRLLQHLIQLREKNQFKNNAPRILINSYINIDQTESVIQQGKISIKQNQLPLHITKLQSYSSQESPLTDQRLLINSIEEHLTKNIVQLQKLFIDGLGLDLSFTISRRNLHYPIKQDSKKKNFWLNSISKKSKAIHSNLIQNSLNLSDIIYQQGYQLHHLFLASFNEKKERISFLDENKGYDIKQVLYVLSMINFNGKLVIDCQNPLISKPEQFTRNVEFLDKMLKEIGYKKTNLDQIDDTSYISAL